MQRWKALAAATLVTLAGCSKEQPKEPAVTPAALAPAQFKPLLTTAWPKMKAACPGLGRYAGDLTFAGVEDNVKNAQPEVQRVSVKFQVARSPKQVPPAFRAAGQVCAFDLSPDGKQMMVPTPGCASICRDQQMSSGITLAL